MAQEAQDLLYSTPDHVKNQLVRDMLNNLYTYGEDKAFDAKVLAALEEAWGFKYVPTERVRSSTLYGPPGHGKTTVCKEACKEVAKLLGLNFKLNPFVRDYRPSRQGFLMVTTEMAGMVSAVDFGGIPSKEHVDREGADGTISQEPYMAKLLDKRLADMRHAGAAVLLFDDFSNASPFIQDTLLSLIEERRFQTLDLGPRGMTLQTANLGAVDGTNASRVSTAVRSRACNYMVEDTVDDWMKRAEEANEGKPYEDCYVAGFLKHHPDMFNTLDPSMQIGAFACPRTWDEQVRRMRPLIALHNEKGGNLPSGEGYYSVVRMLTGGTVGKQAAEKYVSYLQSVLTDAEPLAREAIENGELKKESKERLKAKIGDAVSVDARSFIYQYTSALARRASVKMTEMKDKPKELDKVLTAYAKANFDDSLDSSSTSMGLHLLTKRLMKLQPDLVSKDLGEMGLEANMMKKIWDAIRLNASLDEPTAKAVQAVLSGQFEVTGFSSAYKPGGKAGKKKGAAPGQK